MEQTDSKNDNNSNQGYVTSSILNENLSGTHGKELSEDAKSQIKRFALPIQCAMLGLAILLVAPIVYYLMIYLINVKSVLAAIVVAISYIAILYYIKVNKTSVSIKAIYQAPIKFIIYFAIFKYLFYISNIKTLTVISIMSISYASYEILTQHIISKLKSCAYITGSGLLVLILIKLISGSISNITAYVICIVCVFVMLVKFVLDMKSAKNNFEQTYSDLEA